LATLSADTLTAPGSGFISDGSHVAIVDTAHVHRIRISSPEDLVKRGHASERSAAKRLKQLAELPLLRSLPIEHLRTLAESSETEIFQAGDAVVRQGEPGDSLYLVMEGRVEVLARSEHDGVATESVVASLFEGDAVGELSVLDGLPRSATCVAAVPTECVRLDRDELRAAMRRDWELGERLLAVVAQRLRRADTLLAEHARDPLTGVNNRRALYELYERESRRAQRAARKAAERAFPENEREAEDTGALAVLFCDVDKFKTVNDTYGHQIGDEVLIAVARAMVKLGRATDHVARYGGDEFVMLLPEGGEKGALRLAQHLRDHLRESPPGPVPFSISIGASVVDPLAPPTLDDLMASADKEMYKDKQKGR
jgi:diguanylate cyclase (GGDEF)-like protein